MKTFKQLREAKREINPEAAALMPRAEGELDFVDSHTVAAKEYPVSPNSHTTDNNTKKAVHQPENGDRSPIQQGTSKLADKSGFHGQQTPKRVADKVREGDLKPVKTASSAVQVPAFQESIFVNKPVISESDNDAIEVELLNGDVIEINEDIFNALVDMYEQLNTGNREVFRAAVNESADTFEKILDFVASLHEDQE
jgi:hypothetical protein